jgi:hypothetical protein
MLISSAATMAATQTLPDNLLFQQYTATNGTINAASPISGTSTCDCTGAITGDGFLQRQVTIGGTKYFQTIVLDKQTTIDGTTGNTFADAPFANESFVIQGNGSGIGNQSTVNATGTGTDYTKLGMTTEIFSGTQFSSDPVNGGSDVHVTQTLKGYTDNTYANELSSIGFGLDRAAGDTSPDISLDSTVYLVDQGVTPDPATSPKQVFALRQLKSTTLGTGNTGYLTSDGTSTGADLVSAFGLQPTDPQGAKVDPSGTSTPLAYVDGDTIQLMWLGQTVNDQSFGAETLAVNPDPTTQGTGTGTGSASEQYSSQVAVGASDGAGGFNPYIWSTLFDGVGSGEPTF